MLTILEIAGIKMKLHTLQPYKEIDDFRPFHTKSDKKTDLQIEFIPVNNPWIEDDSISKVDFYLDHELVKNGEKYIGYHCDHQPCHAWMTTDGRKMNVYYLDDFKKYFPTERQIFGPVCLEQILSLYHGFILHSSFVRWKGNGIVFTAPSGTGKSTQAALWKKYEDAEILNGDRSALRNINGRWYAYGFPYSGSSGIFCNESAPVSAVVILEQAKDNILKRSDKLQAFRMIYSQLTLHPWDAEFMDRILADLSELIDSVPVFHLYCRPDAGSVEILRKKMEDLADGRWLCNSTNDSVSAC